MPLSGGLQSPIETGSRGLGTVSRRSSSFADQSAAASFDARFCEVSPQTFDSVADHGTFVVVIANGNCVGSWIVRETWN